MRLETQIIDPGETVQGELFITGYGCIDGAKIVFYPATSVFEEGPSTVSWREITTFTEPTVHWQGTIRTFQPTEAGLTLQMKSRLQPADKQSDYFFDINPGQDFSGIQTEAVWEAGEQSEPHAPIFFELKTRRAVRPGTYPLTFVFTYFNGSEWVNQSQSASFTIRNVLQRNEALFGIAAYSAAIATVIAAILTLVDTWDKVKPLLLGVRHFLFPPF
ncbi:hypothetical protein KBK24_0119215 [Burkholderia sp. K24]|nr:hypothetical protein KBK24_0119215 [Burkholderia sp. K24]